MTSSTPPDAGTGRFAREFRRIAMLAALLLVAFGGIQLWQHSFATTTVAFEIRGENDPTFGGDSTAEWLVQKLDTELWLPDAGAPLVTLPAGTREGSATVRGAAGRQAVEDGRLEAHLRIPSSDGAETKVVVAGSPDDAGTWQFELNARSADDFLARRLSMFASIVDAGGNPVRNLRPTGNTRGSERSSQRGVYDLSVQVETILWAGDRVELDLRDGDAAVSGSNVPTDWFLHSEQASRVITLDRAAPEIVIEEPVVEEETTPPVAEIQPPVEETPPPPDPAVERARRLARLQQQVVNAIQADDWSRARARLREWESAGAGGADVAALTQRIENGERRAQAEQEMATLTGQIGAALAAQDWDQAEALTDRYAGLDANEPRLAQWREAVATGRQAAADAAAEAERLAAEAAQPDPVDEKARVQATLDRYVRAHNERNIQLYLSAFPVTGEQRKRIEGAWDNSKSWSLEMEVGTIQVDGNTATVDYQQTLTMQPNVGRTQTNRGSFRMTLEQRDGEWVIQDNQAR